MLIQVLGPGCSRCRTLYETVALAVRETGTQARVEKVEDIRAILAFDLLMTPGLAIDGQVKVGGRVPGLDEVKRLLTAAQGL